MRRHNTERDGGWARGQTLGLGLLALTLACGRPDAQIAIGDLDFAGGQLRVTIHATGDVDPDSVGVWLDGRTVEIVATSDGWVAENLGAAPGRHRLVARARRGEGPGAVWDARFFRAPPALPALMESDPAAGDEVARSAWLRLALFGRPDPASFQHLGLSCDGAARVFDAELLPDDSVLVNPRPALPPAANCALAWRGPWGVEVLPFAVSGEGPVVEALYDRTRNDAVTPLPDDYFLDDPDTDERQLAIPTPDRGGLILALFTALLHDANELDGWSPLAPLVVETSDALDPMSLPLTPEDSLDPLAAVALVDLAPGAGMARVPFRAQARSDSTGAGTSHTLLAFPARPLDPRGRYAFVVTRRALADPERPLDPSDFFRAALEAPVFGEPVELARVRERLEPVLEELETAARPRIPREDVALVLPIRVRSLDALPADLLEMRAQIQAGPPPALLDYTVEADTTPGSDIAAVIRGTWDAPDWRPFEGPPLLRANVVRDVDGLPVSEGTQPLEFVLAIPAAAESGPVPVIMHQHGNPGDQEEAVRAARRFLAEEGFAVMGFTDVANREISPALAPDGTLRSTEQRIELQVINIFLSLFVNQTLPDHWLETSAEQLAFLRFLEGLGSLDVLPLGAPDGVPDLDLELPPLYHGISEGGNHGQAVLTYAPEIRAAALVVGGARLAEVLLHQQADAFLTQLPAFVPGMLPAEIWAGVTLFQTIYDRQDRHNHLAFAHRNPLEVDGTRRKPSVLLVEGLDDSLVPNAATESAAWALGVPQVDPLRPVPFLDAVDSPLAGNLDEDTTGGLVQYAPVGLPDLPPTPGCAALSPASASEGHYCAQSAAESERLRVHFFRSALGEGAPEIADPYATE